MLITMSGQSGRHSEDGEYFLPEDVKQEEGNSEKENGEDHHDCGANQFILAWPRHFIHFCFDGDQEIRKACKVDNSKAKPGTEEQEQEGNSLFNPLHFSERSTATECAMQ